LSIGYRKIKQATVFEDVLSVIPFSFAEQLHFFANGTLCSRQENISFHGDFFDFAPDSNILVK